MRCFPSMLAEIASQLDAPLNVTLTGDESLSSCFAVTDLAAASIGAVGGSIANLLTTLELARSPRVDVNRRTVSLWFNQSITPVGWTMPPVWDQIAGDYQAKDGWIRLHTNAPHHKRAALSVLECEDDRSAAEQVVKTWPADALETAVVNAGGAAAAMRSAQDWSQHKNGRLIAQEPLIAWSKPRNAQFPGWKPTADRPLAGLRILDLTRVLAGPVATRVLAGYGAEVLRVDPFGWDEPNVVPDVTLGKNCCRLDLSTKDGRVQFLKLLSNAHLFVHGLRADALNGLALGEEERFETAPNHVEVTLNAYGWTGSWRDRRGFDSLVQMSSGVTHAGMNWANTKIPTPLPVQALDHATGYLMAAAAIRTLENTVRTSTIKNARLSLARTAEFLKSYPQQVMGRLDNIPQEDDFSPTVEKTPWGSGRRLAAPISIEGARLYWSSPACELGSSKPMWRP